MSVHIEASKVCTRATMMEQYRRTETGDEVCWSNLPHYATLLNALIIHSAFGIVDQALLSGQVLKIMKPVYLVMRWNRADVLHNNPWKTVTQQWMTLINKSSQLSCFVVLFFTSYKRHVGTSIVVVLQYRVASNLVGLTSSPRTKHGALIKTTTDILNRFGHGVWEHFRRIPCVKIIVESVEVRIHQIRCIPQATGPVWSTCIWRHLLWHRKGKTNEKNSEKVKKKQRKSCCSKHETNYYGREDTDETSLHSWQTWWWTVRNSFSSIKIVECEELAITFCIILL